MVIKKLVATSLLAPMAFLGLNATAFAQPAAPAGPEGAAPAEPEGVAPAGPEGAAPADDSAQPAAPGPNPQIVAFVDHQFPTADADGDGTLTAAEFTAWIGGLKAAELEKAGEAADPAAVQAYADSALANADTDKDSVLSKDELVKFFGG